MDLLLSVAFAADYEYWQLALQKLDWIKEMINVEKYDSLAA